ncbi:CRAL/TRIO domain-containing protein [Serendipita vermifera]|nr:CRAL/TRIO domain-containing protein [Serendipita vermifera]
MAESEEPVVYTPLPVPAVSNHSRPPSLSGVQEEKRLQVISHFSSEEYKLPGIHDNTTLTEIEKYWLTSDCILRYLRATKWQPAEAIKRLEETLKWRREFGIYDRISSDHVKPEGETGLAVTFGYDTSSRPNLYLFPGRRSTEPSMRQIEYAFFMLEQTLELTALGVEDVIVLVDFGSGGGRPPSLPLTKLGMQILQQHYPERLGRLLVAHVPWLLAAFVKIVMAFLDPVTRAKIILNPNVVEGGLVNVDQLIASDGWGGKINFVYEQDKYWPALLEKAKARREANMARWRALGGKIGLDEWSIKVDQ